VSATTIDDLRASLGGGSKVDPAYAAKQLHTVPDAPVVKREVFILDRVRGKRVLEFGASGPMHEAIVKVAVSCFGVDRQDGDGVVGFDLDAIRFDCVDHPNDVLPQPVDGVDLIVCGELLEHLANPGWFLTRLRRQYGGVPVIITVPNAAAIVNSSLLNGIENCNRDHVAWYSWRTIKTLVERVGYQITDFAWYNGKPLTAEGLIFVVE
jgi:hypothetical protein